MLRWQDAKALIEEAKNLHYKMTMWERDIVSKLEAMQPARLTPHDEQTILTMYRRAAGGEKIEYKDNTDENK